MQVVLVRGPQLQLLLLLVLLQLVMVQVLLVQRGRCRGARHPGYHEGGGGVAVGGRVGRRRRELEQRSAAGRVQGRRLHGTACRPLIS